MHSSAQPDRLHDGHRSGWQPGRTSETLRTTTRLALLWLQVRWTDNVSQTGKEERTRVVHSTLRSHHRPTRRTHTHTHTHTRIHPHDHRAKDQDRGRHTQTQAQTKTPHKSPCPPPLTLPQTQPFVQDEGKPITGGQRDKGWTSSINSAVLGTGSGTLGSRNSTPRRSSFRPRGGRRRGGE